MKTKKGKHKEYEDYLKLNSNDEYSKACVDAGDVFGNVLDQGSTCDEAEQKMWNSEPGMTGFMVTMALKGVAHFNPRGEEVREWWNKKQGIKSEEGMANPAVVEVSEDGNITPTLESV